MTAPRVFFSFRSPFSWMAIERLRRAVPDAHDRLEFIPYWEPDRRTAEDLAARGATIHYAAMSKAKHLYILYDTKRIAKSLGTTIAWPVDVQPWWEPSHLAWLRARRLGRAREFYDAVVAARWQRAENISDPSVIAALASSVGLNGPLLADAVNDEEIRREGVDALVTAYEEDVFGVPYFRVGRERFWGFDRVQPFIDALNSVDANRTDARREADVQEPLELVAQDGASYDQDAPGGCG